MSFELHQGIEKHAEQLNAMEFQDIARTLKALAQEQGYSQEFALDELVRHGPAAAAAALRLPKAG